MRNRVAITIDLRFVRTATAAALLLTGGACAKPNAAASDPGSFPGAPDDDFNATRVYYNKFGNYWTPAVTLEIPCPGCGVTPVRFSAKLQKGYATIDLPQIANGAPGRIVARMEAIGNYPDLKLTAGDVAILWLGKINSGRNRFAIYKVSDDADTGLRFDGVLKANKGLYCTKGYHPPPPLMHAIPGPDCTAPVTAYEVSSTAGDAARLINDTRSSFAATRYGMGDLWFSCSGGCCQADSWSFY